MIGPMTKEQQERFDSLLQSIEVDRARERGDIPEAPLSYYLEQALGKDGAAAWQAERDRRAGPDLLPITPEQRARLDQMLTVDDPPLLGRTRGRDRGRVRDGSGSAFVTDLISSALDVADQFRAAAAGDDQGPDRPSGPVVEAKRHDR